jgi:hypothetical protein
MGAKSLQRLLRLLQRLWRRLSFCLLQAPALPLRFAPLPFVTLQTSSAFPDPFPFSFHAFPFRFPGFPAVFLQKPGPH